MTTGSAASPVVVVRRRARPAASRSVRVVAAAIVLRVASSLVFPPPAPRVVVGAQLKTRPSRDGVTACGAPASRSRGGAVTTLGMANSAGDDEAEALRAKAAALREEASALQAEVEQERRESEEAQAADAPPAPLAPAAAEAPPATTEVAAADDDDDPQTSAAAFSAAVQKKSRARADEQQRRRQAQQQSKRNAAPKSDVPWGDRALACVPYVLPMSDVLPFGKYIFSEFPDLATILVLPYAPFIAILNAIPFSGLICFIILSTSSRNPELPRFVRFSMQQAVILDIALIFPQLLGSIFGATKLNLPEAIVEPASTTVFFAVVIAVIYANVANARGEVPNAIPVVSEAADRSIGPF